MLDKPTPTDEQLHILDLARSSTSNIAINAYAGTGKTATLMMIEKAVKADMILYLVFNKRNAEEAEEKMGPTTTVRTFNGIGHRAWSSFIGKQLGKPNPRKPADILRELIKARPRSMQPDMWEVFWDVVAGVKYAKAVGYAPAHLKAAKPLTSQEAFHDALEERPDDFVSDLIDTVLEVSIKRAFEGNIDYDDQVYMPALYGGKFQSFPLVLVDEEQDLNPTNHALLNSIVRQRVMGVGDPFQSIYGFRGGVQGGMRILTEKFRMEETTLSVSFRCPEAIVKNAQWRVPKFRWAKEGGHVERLSDLAINAIPDGAAILCRNNAPLFRLALFLLANKRSVSVAGSDIGPKLVAIMKKLGPENLPRDYVLGAINDWLSEKVSKESTTAHDIAECMRVFASFGADLGTAIAYAEHLFKQQGTIQLMTGHKAKGLEWDHVIHIDPHLIKSEEQDLNLRYVIQTRSANYYAEVEGTRITE